MIRKEVIDLLHYSVENNKNMLIFGHKGVGKTRMITNIVNEYYSNRPIYKISFSTVQDAKSNLIGNNQYDVNKGTYFVKSEFIKAIQKNDSIIILDELNRASVESFNFLFPILDNEIKTVYIDDTNETIYVGDNVIFIATANKGVQYVNTNILDDALLDRFDIKVTLNPPSSTEIRKIITSVYTTNTPVYKGYINDILSLYDIMIKTNIIFSIRQILNMIELRIKNSYSLKKVCEIILKETMITNNYSLILQSIDSI